jgi:hypothetical protein
MSDEGQTTRQMKEAPEGARYIWPSSFTRYARDLASHLGREDLEIIPAARMNHLGLQHYIGGRRFVFVIDHAALRELTSQIREEIFAWNAMQDMAEGGAT